MNKMFKFRLLLGANQATSHYLLNKLLKKQSTCRCPVMPCRSPLWCRQKPSIVYFKVFSTVTHQKTASNFKGQLLSRRRSLYPVSPTSLCRHRLSASPQGPWGHTYCRKRKVQVNATPLDLSNSNQAPEGLSQPPEDGHINVCLLGACMFVLCSSPPG